MAKPIKSRMRKSAMFVTQATVQVELFVNEAVIIINPITGFNVKYGDKDCLVFISVDAANEIQLKALVFKKTQRFLTKNRAFFPQLADAAFNGTKIEIKIKEPTTLIAKNNKPIEITIESIKIPATVKS